MDWKNRIVGAENMAPGDLTSNPGNWRKHPRAQAQALEGMLGEVGAVQGVIWNRRTERLVDGHLRVELARRQKVSTIPVTIVDLSEDEEKLVLATLDPIGAMAGHDDSKLRGLLDDLTGEHDRAIAAVLDDLARRVPKKKPKERDGEQTLLEQVAEKWQVQTGDLWTIPSLATAGKAHRILCGDATAEDDVKRLMGDERAVLFATDPPYAVEYDGKRAVGFGTECGKDWKDAHADIDIGSIGAYVKAAAAFAAHDVAPWYCWHANKGDIVAQIIAAWNSEDVFVHQEIIWVKSHPAFSRGIYMQKHEPCLFGWKRGNDPRITKGSPQSAGRGVSTVWEYPAPKNRGLHPTMKPVELFEIPMQMHTLQGELCYEPFSGSGTQLVAAERMGRICYAMEIAPHFVAVALERLSELGLEPKRGEA